MGVSQTVSWKSGQTDVFQVSEGTLWHKWLLGGNWSNEGISGPSGGTSEGSIVATFPEQVPQVAIVGGQCYVTVEDQSGRVREFNQGSDDTWWAAELP
jgi:hypothetical protein